MELCCPVIVDGKVIKPVSTPAREIASYHKPPGIGYCSSNHRKCKHELPHGLPPNLCESFQVKSLAIQVLLAVQIHAGAIPFGIQRHEFLNPLGNSLPETDPPVHAYLRFDTIQLPYLYPSPSYAVQFGFWLYGNPRDVPPDVG